MLLPATGITQPAASFAIIPNCTVTSCTITACTIYQPGPIQLCQPIIVIILIISSMRAVFIWVRECEVGDAV